MNGAREMTIVVLSDGSARCIYSDDLNLASLGQIHIRRASTVEPDAAGDWHADLSQVGGPRLGPFARRRDALAAEQSWLAINWLERRSQSNTFHSDLFLGASAWCANSVFWIGGVMRSLIGVFVVLFVIVEFVGCLDQTVTIRRSGSTGPSEGRLRAEIQPVPGRSTGRNCGANPGTAFNKQSAKSDDRDLPRRSDDRPGTGAVVAGDLAR